jgi:hypothetical protein
MNEKGVRIHDLARRLAVPTREVITFLEGKGVELQGPAASIDGPTADMVLKEYGAKGAPRSQAKRSSVRTAPRQPLGRTFAPPKPAPPKPAPVKRLEPPTRPTPDHMAANPVAAADAGAAKHRETPSGKPSEGQNNQRQPNKTNKTFEPRSSEQRDRRPPAKRGRTFAPPAQDSAAKDRPQAKRGRTFAPPTQDSAAKDRPQPRRGRTFAPSAQDLARERPQPKHGRAFEAPQPDADGSLVEKTPGRASGKKREFGRKTSTSAADRGTSKKRDFPRKAAPHDKSVTKKPAGAELDGNGGARKSVKAGGRRYEKTAEGFRHQPLKLLDDGASDTVVPQQRPRSPKNLDGVGRRQSKRRL